VELGGCGLCLQIRPLCDPSLSLAATAHGLSPRFNAQLPFLPTPSLDAELACRHFVFTLVTGPRRSLKLKPSATRIYAPQIRARLGTTTHFCEVVAATQADDYAAMAFPPEPSAAAYPEPSPEPYAAVSFPSPPWRQPRFKSMVSSVNSHTNATRIGWHLWEIDLIFAPGLPPGW